MMMIQVTDTSTWKNLNTSTWKNLTLLNTKSLGYNVESHGRAWVLQGYYFRLSKAIQLHSGNNAQNPYHVDINFQLLAARKEYTPRNEQTTRIILQFITDVAALATRSCWCAAEHERSFQNLANSTDQSYAGICSAVTDFSLIAASVGLKWGLEGKTKMVDAEMEGWNPAEYLREVNVTLGRCNEPEASGTSL